MAEQRYKQKSTITSIPQTMVSSSDDGLVELQHIHTICTCTPSAHAYDGWTALLARST